MCGIAGYFCSGGINGAEAANILATMAGSLTHRGPDDSGQWFDSDAGIALGHRRLSILDLSPLGHQPMQSSCGRYVVTFNGEIYNFRALRDELATYGHQFRGHSDTEVLLSSVTQWGLRAALSRFNGMFAFGLWDRHEHTLYLVRDRIGEKPLYYGWIGETLVFGSELKAIRAYPGFAGEVNRDALALYLRHTAVPAPHSIYRDVHKLLPGQFLCIRKAAGRPSVQAISYWPARSIAEAASAQPFAGSRAEAADRLESLLRDAVTLRMEADVPVGAFLSGGVDSSLVVALMQTQASQAVKTFTIGFYDKAYDEAQYADAIARHLGTDHTELYVTPEQAMDVIARLPTLYDEPLSDSSQIPTFLVSELARRHVTVSLSGDGGDELFGGYSRYTKARTSWNAAKWMPFGLRHMAGDLIARAATDPPLELPKWMTPSLLRSPGVHTPSSRIRQIADVLRAPSPEALYLWFISHWREGPADTVVGARDATTLVSDAMQWPELSDFTQKMMYVDAVTYLPDVILTKVDRASMGVSLESRIPLLDPRVVEFAWHLPTELRIHRSQAKQLLRDVLYRYVPRSLIERPKQGFSAPIAAWLRGPLRDWAEGLIGSQRLHREGFFNPEPIRTKWAQHLSGERDWHQDLWDVLMFQAWYEETHRSDVQMRDARLESRIGA